MHDIFSSSASTRRLLVFCLAFLLLAPVAFAQALTVARLAGSDVGRGYTDGTGAAARFNATKAIATDTAGNAYIVDSDENVVRKMTPAGVVTTFAGRSGITGSVDGWGGAARFSQPVGIAVDARDFVYVADSYSGTIRRISPQGVVTHVVPNSTFTYAGGVAVDPSGNIYVVDAFTYTIRVIRPSGAVSLVAGSSGVEGTADGVGSAARFGFMHGLAWNGATGELLVAESDRVRRVAINGSTFAGTVTTVAVLGNYVNGVTVDASGVYAAVSTAVVMRISGGTAEIYAGDRFNMQGSNDGSLEQAKFIFPSAIAAAPGGILYVVDYGTYNVRRIAGGFVSTIAGTASQHGLPGGTCDSALFNGPTDTAVDSHGNIFVADSYNSTIDKITPACQVQVFAGSVGHIASSDGTGANASFLELGTLAIDTSDNLFVVDGSAIRRITPAAVVTTYAGVADQSGSTNGNGTNARFSYPFGIAVDGSGSVFVADQNHVIRKISPSRDVTLVAGAVGQSGSADGMAGMARFNVPAGMAFAADGTLYVADYFNETIRKVTMPDAVVTTVAGSPLEWGSNDGTGAAARFSAPHDLAIGSNGTLYVSDGLNNIRQIVGNVVTTVAGFAMQPGNVSGTGTIARFDNNAGLSADTQGNLYIADQYANNIRKARLPGIDDVPSASTTTPPIHTVVQLGTAPDTATSWQWSIVRRPSGSTAELSSTTVRNPTFTPDVADLYTLLLRAEGPAGVRYSTIDILPTDPCTPIASVVATVSDSACLASGGTATVSVSGGGTVTYQWGWRSASGGAITPLAGETSATYAIDPADFSGGGAKYLVAIVTSDCGVAMNSNDVLVNAGPSAVISASSGVFAGATQNYAAVADGSPATYAWSITNGTITAGASTSHLAYTAGASGEVVLSVTVTDGCAVSSELHVPILARPAGASMLYLVTPCRVFDSRNGAPIANHSVRWISVGGQCGVPADALSVAANVTVVAPSATGWVALFPDANQWSGTSTLNYRASKTRAGNAIVSLNPSGQLALKNEGSSVNVLIDVTGYFK
jgi:sugar lactone lactonase YvrE